MNRSADEELLHLEKKLRSNRRAVRMEAMEMVDQILESYAEVSLTSLKPLAERLLPVGVDSSDREMQRAALSVLVSIFAPGAVPGLSLDPIAQLASQTADVAVLHHCIDLLGWSENPRYRPLIETFLSHENESVRDGARVALDELQG